VSRGPKTSKGIQVSDILPVFWSWFPIGTAGIRTLLLFISALSVFVLRVAQLHIGGFYKRAFTGKALICNRASNNILAGRDFHQIPFPIEHCPHLGLVLLLSMVVQRSLHVVRSGVGELGLDSGWKVRARYCFDAMGTCS